MRLRKRYGHPRWLAGNPQRLLSGQHLGSSTWAKLWLEGFLGHSGWTKPISHHFETMRSHCLLFAGASSVLNFAHPQSGFKGFYKKLYRTWPKHRNSAVFLKNFLPNPLDGFWETHRLLGRDARGPGSAGSGTRSLRRCQLLVLPKGSEKGARSPSDALLSPFLGEGSLLTYTTEKIKVPLG